MRYPCALLHCTWLGPFPGQFTWSMALLTNYPWSPVRDLNGRQRRALEGDGSGRGHSNERTAAAGDDRRKQRADSTISSSDGQRAASPSRGQPERNTYTSAEQMRHDGPSGIATTITCTRREHELVNLNAHIVRRGLLLTTPRPIVCCTLCAISEHRSVKVSGALARTSSQGQVCSAPATF